MNPPNSGPNDFPSPFDPIPPTAGYGNGPGGAPSGGSPRPGVISLDAIGEAWNLVQPNLGTWLGAAFVYAVITGAINGMQWGAQNHSGVGSPNTPISTLLSIVGYFVGLLLGGGLLKMSINTVRTGRTELADMFNVGDVLLNLWLAGILTGIATAVGLCFCLLPGIYIGIGLSFTQMIIVDQKVGAIEAMGKSWAAVTPQWLSMFVLGFVLGLVALLGLLALVVGLLVAVPVIYVTLAVVYRDLFLKDMVYGAPTIYPNAPIADPNG